MLPEDGHRLFQHFRSAKALWATLLFTAFLPKVGIQFDWVTYHWIAGSVLTTSILFHVRRLTERREYADGSTISSRTTYSNSVSDNTTYCAGIFFLASALGNPTQPYVSNSSTIVTAAYQDGQGHVLSQERHSFCGNPGDIAVVYNYNPLAYSVWREGKEFQTDILDSAGTKTWMSDVNTWEQATVSWWGTTIFDTQSQNQAPANNPHLSQTDTTLDDGEVSRKTHSYDQYNNETDLAGC